MTYPQTTLNSGTPENTIVCSSSTDDADENVSNQLPKDDRTASSSHILPTVAQPSELPLKALHCSVCDKNLPDLALMKVHMTEHSVTSFYSCNMCDLICPKFEEFKSHSEVSHDILSAALCEVCNKIFLNINELNFHIQTDHKEPSVVPSDCVIGERPSTDQTRFFEHLEAEHSSHAVRTSRGFDSMSTSSIQSEITSFSDRVDVQHAPSPQFAIGSPLPQLDGQHDIAVVHQNYQPDQGTSHLHLSRSTLKSNYALNQSKQVQPLLKNSKIA